MLQWFSGKRVVNHVSLMPWCSKLTQFLIILGTLSNEWAGHRACKCLQGFYRTDRFGPCMECPSNGVDCQNEFIILQPGHFWFWNSDDHKQAYINFTKDIQIENESYNQEYSKCNNSLPTPYKCPYPQACKGGVHSLCSKGYTGVLCDTCSEGHYKNVNSGCSKCSYGWIISQLVVIAVLILVVTGIFTTKKKKKKNGRTQSDLILSRVKIVIGFYQVTSGVIRSLTFVNWPEELSQASEYLQILNLNLLQAVPISCISSRFTMNAFQKMTFMVCGNFCLVIAAAIVYRIKKWQVCKQNIQNEQKKASISVAKEKAYHFVLFVLFVTFPSTTDSIVNVMPFACQKLCSEQQCSWYLKSDLELKCFDSYFNRLVFSIILFLCFSHGALFRLFFPPTVSLRHPINCLCLLTIALFCKKLIILTSRTIPRNPGITVFIFYFCA